MSQFPNVNYNVVEFGVADTTAKVIGQRPKSSIVVDAGVIVATAFNGTTPTANLGPSGDPDGYATALDLSAAGRKAADELATSDDLFSGSNVISDVVTFVGGGSNTTGRGFAYVAWVAV